MDFSTVLVRYNLRVALQCSRSNVGRAIAGSFWHPTFNLDQHVKTQKLSFVSFRFAAFRRLLGCTLLVTIVATGKRLYKFVALPSSDELKVFFHFAGPIAVALIGKVQ